MANNKRKGNRNRRRTITYLEDLGYQVDVVEKQGRFGVDKKEGKLDFYQRLLNVVIVIN